MESTRPSFARDLRNQLAATALATLGLYLCAFGIPVIFRAAGLAEPVQSALPDAPFWVLAPFVVLIGPWLEELIFRKWLIDGVRKLSGSFLVASLISTALWIASHVPTSMQAGLIYATTGLILCWLRYSTNRLWTCVVVHMAYNAPAAFMLSQLA